MGDGDVLGRSEGYHLQGVHERLRFSKNSRKIATSPSPALDCYWLYKNHQPIEVTVHAVLLHCVESFEGLIPLCRQGRGCSEL